MAKTYNQYGKNVKDKNHHWKGDGASYVAKHASVETEKGRPNFCQICKKKNQKRYAWANKDHKYSRNSEDYLRLCYKCHCKYDSSKNKNEFIIYPIPNDMLKKNKIIKERVGKIDCVICGKRMQKNQFQKRKKMCAKCSYELKKTRIKAKYWMKIDPNSKQAQLWAGRLQVLNNQIKNK